MACIDADTVLEWVEGRASPQRATAIVAHLDDCVACRELVSHEAAEAGPHAETALELPRSRRSESEVHLADTLNALEPFERRQAELPQRPEDLPEVDAEIYVREGEIARGGLGRIVQAYDRRSGRTVAIKEMLVDGDEAASRFVREALITANLQHPAIVPVYEIGRWPDGQPFYAMKLVRGWPLSKLIADCADDRARLALLPHVIAIADALAYAHDERIIHRDLKPHNVLCGAHGETVVIDWGLARRNDEAEAAEIARSTEDGDATVAGTVMGTPAYMAPEQARGERVDARADVYAIGAILYRVLTGRTPYTGRTSDELVEQVKAASPPSVVALSPGVPADLAAIVERAMARDPAARYASADELASDLRRYSTGQLVHVHRYTIGERVRRFVMRHRAAVAVTAFAFVALLVLGGVALRNVVAARRSAEASAAEARGRLAVAYADRARSELAAEHSDRALAFATAAAALDIDDVGLRFVAARALDALPALRRRPDPAVMDARFAPGSDELVISSATAIERWSPARDAVRWRIAGGAGDLVILDEHAFAIVRADRARILSLDDGRTLAELPMPALQQLSGLVGTDPARRWLAVGTTDGTVLLYDLRERALVATLPVARGTRVNPELVSPDGARVLVGVWAGRQPSMAIVDRAGRSIAELCTTCWKVVGEGSTIVVAGARRGEAVRIAVIDWDGRPQLEIELDSALGLRGLAVDPDHHLLAIAKNDGEIELRDLSNGRVVWHRAMRDAVREMQFDRAGRLWVLGNFNSLGVLDATTGIALGRWQVPGYGLRLDGRAAHVAVLDPAVGTTAFSVGELPIAVLAPGGDAPAAGTCCAAFTADGSLALGQGDSLTVIDRAGTHRVVGRHADPLAALQPLANGGVFAMTRGGDAAIWDLASASIEVRLGGTVGEVAPDGAIAATADATNTLALWDRRSGARTHELGRAREVVRAIRWSPASDLVAAIFENGAVTVWSRDGRVVRVLEPTARGVDIAFSPDGRWLARACSFDFTLYALAPGGSDLPLAEQPAQPNVFAVAFSPDGRRVVFAGNGFVESWDTTTGAKHTSIAPDTVVMTAVVSRDGHFIFTGGLDRTLRVWDAETGAEYLALAATAEILQLGLSADGRRLVARTSSGAFTWTLRALDVPTTELGSLLACRTANAVIDGVLRQRPVDAASCNRTTTKGR